MMKKCFFRIAVLAVGICALFFAGCKDEPEFGSHETTKFVGTWEGKVQNNLLPPPAPTEFQNSFTIKYKGGKLTFTAQAGMLVAQLQQQPGPATEITGSFVPITGDNNYSINIDPSSDLQSGQGFAYSTMPTSSATITFTGDATMNIDCHSDLADGAFSATYTKQP